MPPRNPSLAALLAEDPDREPLKHQGLASPEERAVRETVPFLRPLDVRIAHMSVAGLSLEEIGTFLQMPVSSVNHILGKERVQRYMLQLHATFAGDLRPYMDRMRARLEHTSFEMLENIETIHRESFQERGDIKRAKLAVVTAQDILDRAGASAPKRLEVENHHTFNIDPEQGERIIEVLKEDDEL